MLAAAMIGSAPARLLVGRAIRRMCRFNWRFRLALSGKPRGWHMVEEVKYLDCSP